MSFTGRTIDYPQLSFSPFFIVLLTLFVAGCATSGPKPTAKLEDVIARENSTNQEIKDINDKLFASVSAAPQDKDYVLGEGDLLEISVFEAQELKAEMRVGARGSVTLPLLGAIEIKGLTAREAEQKIEDAYRQKYLHDPHVSVFVKEQVSGKITLLGAVKKPGSYPYLTRQRVFDVLATAEGLSDKAGRMVHVRRNDDDPEHPSTFVIDLFELVNTGRTELNMEIKGGDVIYVPEAGTVYVDGAVRKPGSYPIKDTMSVPEAIAAAGGFTTFAAEGNIKLVRSIDGGQKEVVQVSLKDAEGSGRQIQLKDHDIIFVETNKVEALMYGIRLNTIGGLFGIGYQPPVQ